MFGLTHLLGFRFAPRIRDLADKRLYIHGDQKQCPTLAEMIGDNINVKHIRAHWDQILRLAASIKQGTVTASPMLHDRSFENQRYRASDLNLVVAAIVL